MKLQTNYINLGIRILLFYGFIFFLIFFGYNILSTFNWITLILFLVMVSIVFIILRNGIKEPNFIEIKNSTLIIRTFPYLWNKTIPIKNIKGFSETFKSYSGLLDSFNSTIKFPTYIIYIDDNSNYHLTSYNFKEFKKTKHILKKKIKFLGKEKESYKLGSFREYYFDKK